MVVLWNLEMPIGVHDWTPFLKKHCILTFLNDRSMIVHINHTLGGAYGS